MTAGSEPGTFFQYIGSEDQNGEADSANDQCIKAECRKVFKESL